MEKQMIGWKKPDGSREMLLDWLMKRNTKWTIQS